MGMALFLERDLFLEVFMEQNAQFELNTSRPRPDFITKVKAQMSRFFNRIWRDKWLYIMLLPGVIFFIVFIYVPLAGNIIAFQDYSPFLGFYDSPWVGLKHFERLINDRDVVQALENTIVLNVLQLVIVFPIPIVLALMLNEVRNTVFKRTVQTIVYIPYFISFVVIVGIWYQLFGSNGLINQVIVEMGGDKIRFLTSPDWFRFNFITQNVWQGSGYGTIIYLAALTGISQDLYEAASIDGASHWQKVWNVTLPGIRPVILVLFIISLGNILTTGFEHVFLLLNASNESTAQVLDTFVYYRGIVNGNFSFATAVGLVKGIVGLVLVLGANQLAKRFGDGGIL